MAAALVLLWQMDAFVLLTDTDWLRSQIQAAGAWAPLLYGLLMLLTFPVFLAGPVVWLSVALWALPLAFLFASMASILCGWVYFAGARYLGREWVASKIPEKVRRYQDRLESKPVRTIVILRVLLWVNPAVDALIGVTSISTKTYLASSALALIPITLVHVVITYYGINFFS